MLEVEGKTFHKFLEIKEYKTNTYKNFCPINKNNTHDIIFDLFSDESQNNNLITNYIISGKNNQRYYSDNFSLDEIDYQNNYGNVLAQVSLNRQRLFIEEGDNSISLKCQYYSRYRILSKKYFVVRKTTYFLSFNFKTKIFYAGVFQGKNKRKIGTTLKINPTIGILYNHLYNIKIHKDINVDNYLHFFLEKIWNRLSLKNERNFKYKTPYELYILTKYIVNNVKIPNNWVKFSNIFVSKKYLKKYNMNLVDSVIGMLNIKGSKVKKIMNEIEFVNFDKLTILYNILGIDKFNKLENKIFEDKNDTETLFFSKYWNSFNKNHMYDFNTLYSAKLLNSEKNRIINLSKYLDDSVFNTFIEHLKFKEKLKNLGEDVKFKFETLYEFNNEHEEFSKLIDSYRKGEVERYYGEVNVLEDPIIYGEDIYYPVLLKKTIDYEKESQHQRNCVRTYAERPDCLIFSIRKGSYDGEERSTVEYQYRKNEILNVQEKTRFNTCPDQLFLDVAKIQLSKINLMYKLGTLKLPKMIKTYRNGKTTEQISKFDNEYNEIIGLSQIIPSWDYKTEELSYSFPVMLDNLFDDFIIDELP